MPTDRPDAHREVWPLGLVLGLIMVHSLGSSSAAATPREVNVRAHGASGDGKTLDTKAINEAIRQCAASGGGRVVFPPGRYLSGTVHLQSHTTLVLEAGARLVGSPDLNQYRHFQPPAFMPETKWLRWHRALILADGAEDVGLVGPGTIDGNQVFDVQGEEKMRGPHTILLGKCRGVTIRDLSIVDSANYAILFEVTDRVEIRHVKITGGWDGVHFRGGPGHPCRHVNISDCEFFTGDDAIAGRYWEDVRITDCVLNSSCNCVRLIGPAVRLQIDKCRMYGPGLHPHRTSKRTATLSGLNLQPGGWDATQGALDDVQISDITMENVATPFHFSLKPGNTAGRIAVERVTAKGVYHAASSVESWAETPFTDVRFRDIHIEFAGGGTRDQVRRQIKAPSTEARPLPVWGFYARNVKQLTFERVDFRWAKPDQRPAFLADHVERLTLHSFKFPHQAGESDGAVLKNVGELQVSDTDLHRPAP